MDTTGRTPDGGDQYDEATGEDEVALAALRAGEEGAWEALWERHHTWVWRFALGIVRNEADADDVAAEALVRALARFTAADPPRSLRGYLRAVARNLTVDLVRLRERDLEVGERLATEWLNRHDLIDLADERRGVVRALQDMPDRQRYVLIRLLLDGVSLPEVAAELDLTTNATSQLAFRARRRFRDAYRGTTWSVAASTRQRDGWLRRRLRRGIPAPVAPT